MHACMYVCMYACTYAYACMSLCVYTSCMTLNGVLLFYGKMQDCQLCGMFSVLSMYATGLPMVLQTSIAWRLCKQFRTVADDLPSDREPC